MRTSRAMAAAILTVVGAGCHKDSKVSTAIMPRPSDEVDAMWKLAPDKLDFGFVASSRAIDLLARLGPAALEVLKLPELQQYQGIVTATLAGIGMPSGHPFDLGFAAKPAAFFIASKATIAIVPLGDRDKLVAALHGTRGDVDHIGNAVCKSVEGVYACSDSLASLDHLGKGPVT